MSPWVAALVFALAGIALWFAGPLIARVEAALIVSEAKGAGFDPHESERLGSFMRLHEHWKTRLLSLMLVGFAVWIVVSELLS